MPNKYNLALIPTKEKISSFVDYAQNTFPIKPAEYLLGTHSIPHVTLCHFESEDENLDEIANQVRTLNSPPIQLTFATHRSKSYPTHPIWGQWSWVSLMPDKLGELKKLHLQLAQIVTPTNAAFDDYDPHLTLFNSKDHDACSQINLSPSATPVLSDTFHLILGRLDDMGQITEIIYFI